MASIIASPASCWQAPQLQQERDATVPLDDVPPPAWLLHPHACPDEAQPTFACLACNSDNSQTKRMVSRSRAQRMCLVCQFQVPQTRPMRPLAFRPQAA